MKVHVWVPGLNDRVGGIQTFSKFFVRALETCADVTVFSKHDISREGSGHVSLWLRTIHFACRLFVACLRDRPDLIISTHVNFIPVAHIVNRLLGTPFWFVAHGVECWTIKNLLVRQAILQARLILAVSKTTKDRLLNAVAALDSEKVIVFPNTADSVRFDIHPASEELTHKYKVGNESWVLLTVARLDASERYKGYDTVIEVLSELKKTMPDIRYIIVGDGDDRTRVKDLIEQLDMKKTVTLVGRVSDEELPAYYSLADTFIMPSSGEGFGIVFLEALFSGVPCIGGAHDGARDALLDGKLGTLINPTDKEEIKTAILNSFDQHKNPHGLRNQALAEFGPQSFTERLQKLIKP